MVDPQLKVWQLSNPSIMSITFSIAVDPRPTRPVICKLWSTCHIVSNVLFIYCGLFLFGFILEKKVLIDCVKRAHVLSLCSDWLHQSWWVRGNASSATLCFCFPPKKKKEKKKTSSHSCPILLSDSNYLMICARFLFGSSSVFAFWLIRSPHTLHSDITLFTSEMFCVHIF